MAIKRKLECENENEYGDGVGWIRGRVLGKGSFGRVYKAARKSQLISCLPAELAVKSSETSVSSTLRHEKEVFRHFKGSDYIIQCFGGEATVGDKGGVMAYNLLLEYCSGGSLADRIRELWRLPESEVRTHTESLLMGLSHIHALGYVHCDLKPENILLVPKGEGGGFTAKIGDFGVSKRRNKKLDDRHWRGTLMYLSPEAAAGCEQEAPADIWALGCVVLQMLTGKRPWEGRKSEILTSIVSKNGLPKIPDYISMPISTAARDFLMCCFERHPGRRLSAKSLLDHPFVKCSTGHLSPFLWGRERCDVSRELEDHEPDQTKSEDEFISSEYDDYWMFTSCNNAKTEDEGFHGSITARHNYQVAFPIAAGA